MKLHCGNKSAINIAHHPVQNDRTKLVEIDRHFIKGKLKSALVCAPCISTGGQVAGVLINGCSGL